MNILSFNKKKYNFHEIIANFIGTDDLCQIEADLNDKVNPDGENSIYKNMEQTDHYEHLYERLNGEEGKQFYNVFKDFIKNVIRPQYDEPIYYQKKPTHRIHFKNSSGAARFHRDSDYGHSRAEINYSVPQTPMYGTNAIWIESEEGKADYSPLECEVGECAEFKGAYLKHGAKHNYTGQTRVSFDFRIIRYSEASDYYKNKSQWEKRKSDHPLFKKFEDVGFCE